MRSNLPDFHLSVRIWLHLKSHQRRSSLVVGGRSCMRGSTSRVILCQWHSLI